MVSKFAIRWLQNEGLSLEEARQKAELAYRRSRRFPTPMPFFYSLAIFMIEWFFPLFFLGSLSRASRLSQKSFEKFDHKVHHCRLVFPRLLYYLIRFPLWAQLCADATSQKGGPHPLSGKVSVPSQNKEFDVIVIGSGAGGAPLAWELTNSGFKVGVVESGGLIEPSTTSEAVEKYYYKQGMTLSAKGCIFPSFLGDTVGGTTSINSGTCLPATPQQLKKWDQKLGTHFAEGELDPYFKVAQEMMGVTVPPKSLLGPSAAFFEKGLNALGREGAYVLPRSAPNCEGAGRCCFGCPTHAKLSTDLTFLPEAVEKGAIIFSRSQATKIREISEGVEVEVQHANQLYKMKAKKVVISGGTYGTPRLIRKNRLGSDWREVGRHFRMHPATKVFAYFSEPVNGEKGVPQGMGYRHPDLPKIVFEGVFTPRAAAATLIPTVGERYRFWLNNYSHVASFGMMLIETTEGRVLDIASWPILRYRMNDQDLREVIRAVFFLAEVFFAAGAERILLPLVSPHNEVGSVEELRQLDLHDFDQLHLTGIGFHAQGTASMGEVVNTDLSIKGTNHLYVCDASVLPLSPGVNPQITVMALSLQLADKMKNLIS